MFRFVIVAVCAAATAVVWSGSAEAAKAKFERTKPHVNVGTIGHIGPGEGAIGTIRMNVPSDNQDGGPACEFDGIAILSTNLPGTATMSQDVSVDSLDQVFEIDLSLTDSRDLVLVPFGVQATVGMRIHYLFEVLSNGSASMDQCGLDIAIDVFDLTTGETRARHTPFFNGYRPQFYFRTTDVNGGAGAE